MLVSARSRLILEKMLVSRKALSLSDYARYLNVSTRSVRRDLEEINHVLKSYGLKLISSQDGYKIDGPYEAIHHFKWHLFDLSHSDFTPDQRKNFILQKMLTMDKVKITDLANELTVTKATIRSDLLRLDAYLPKDTYIERTPGYGLVLVGDEVSKRHLIKDTVRSQLSQHMILQYLYPTNQSNQVTWMVETKLDHIIDSELLNKTHNVLQLWRETQIYSVEDDAYLSLVIHFSIALSRITNGLTLEDLPFENKQANYDDALQLLKSILNDQDITISEQEVNYLANHLENASSLNYRGLLNSQDIKVSSIAKQLIQEVEKQYGIKFSDHSLLHGLSVHLKSALQRIDKGLKIQNPLIDCIKRDYSELFSYVMKAMIKIYGIDESYEEEIGYLVLHFGASLLKFEQRQDFKALVICSSGIGTSKMLITKLNKRIPQLKTLTSSSVYNAINSDDHERYDIILSTIDLGKVPFEYHVISPILMESDIQNIENQLQLIQTKNRDQFSSATSIAETIEHYESINKTINLIIGILKNFEVQELNSKSAKLDDLVRAMNMVAYSNDLNENVEETISLFQSKKNYGGFGITNTEIALFHERHSSISKPVFKVFPLSNPVTLMGLDDKPMEVSTFVLLLAPEKLDQEELEVLSYLSALIIEDDTTVSTFESQDETLISQLLAQKLDMFIIESIRRKS